MWWDSGFVEGLGEGSISELSNITRSVVEEPPRTRQHLGEFRIDADQSARGLAQSKSCRNARARLVAKRLGMR